MIKTFFCSRAYGLLALFLLLTSLLSANERPFVFGRLSCQLGNNLFQVATTCALAWDHQAEPCFPALTTVQTDNMLLNYQHVFFRCNSVNPGPTSIEWALPLQHNFSYMDIPYQPNMAISGTFQCEKYFAHHRERLLQLFAPSLNDQAYIRNKYHYILDHPRTVGIQIRWFGVKQDAPWWQYLVQYGYDYLEKAIAYFPKDTLFVVSSNNLEFARMNLPHLENVIFLENEPHYIDFFILSMCKHNIITNSTFGWWAAWLNKNPEKTVIVPEHWVQPRYELIYPNRVWLDNWIKIEAEWRDPEEELKPIKQRSVAQRLLQESVQFGHYILNLCNNFFGAMN